MFRVDALVAQIKKFRAGVLIQEGILSKAQVEGMVREPTQHNYQQHMLAQFHHINNISCHRVAREAQWHYTVSKAKNNLAKQDVKLDIISFPKQFRPSCCLKDVSAIQETSKARRTFGKEGVVRDYQVCVVMCSHPAP